MMTQSVHLAEAKNAIRNEVLKRLSKINNSEFFKQSKLIFFEFYQLIPPQAIQ
jgi:hypothetical protein